MTDIPSAARAVALHIVHSIEQSRSGNPQMLGAPAASSVQRESRDPQDAVHRAACRLQRNVIQISRMSITAGDAQLA